MNYDAQFNKIYDHVSDSIAFDNCHETDEEKDNFLKDFKFGAEWLMGWNSDNLSDKELHDLAKDILLERKA